MIGLASVFFLLAATPTVVDAPWWVIALLLVGWVVALVRALVSAARGRSSCCPSCSRWAASPWSVRCALARLGVVDRARRGQRGGTRRTLSSAPLEVVTSRSPSGGGSPSGAGRAWSAGAPRRGSARWRRSGGRARARPRGRRRPACRGTGARCSSTQAAPDVARVGCPSASWPRSADGKALVGHRHRLVVARDRVPAVVAPGRRFTSSSRSDRARPDAGAVRGRWRGPARCGARR